MSRQGRPKCRTCGCTRKLKPSQLHPGEWVCESPAKCSERMTRAARQAKAVRDRRAE